MKKSPLSLLGLLALPLAVRTSGQLPWTATQLSQARKAMGAIASKDSPLV